MSLLRSHNPLLHPPIIRSGFPQYCETNPTRRHACRGPRTPEKIATITFRSCSSGRISRVLCHQAKQHRDVRYAGEAVISQGIRIPAILYTHLHTNDQEIPLPYGATLARRIGRSLCIADKENYNMVDLEGASLFPIIPLSQAPDSAIAVKPSITVVGDNEYLIISWTGASTIGLFITGDGDPVRGTVEWPRHPEAVCMSRD